MIDFNKKMNLENKGNLENDFNSEETKKRKKIRFFSIIIITAFIIFSGRVIMSSPQANQWLEERTFWGKIRHLTESSEKKLMGEEEDRINILLLGVGGDGHEGGQLADTIILLSLKPSTKEVALVSLPRDMAVPSNLSSSWRKINSINAIAEARNTGSGGKVSIENLSQLLNLEIPYYVRLDFAGFVNIIDELGGIEVNVENTLSDRLYPIEGEEDNPDYYARFKHLYIEKGLQEMSGSLALKYVRSRHASGIEGSDFARARRQQIVLEALKKRLLSLDMLLKPATVTKVVSELDNSINTNLNIWEMLRLWNNFKDIDNNNIINHVFDDGPGGMLTATRGENGAYILLPRTGNFTEIQNFVNNIFTKNTDSNLKDLTENKKIVDTEDEVITEDKKYKSNVIVINGTWITGLAANTAEKLKENGFNILNISNANERDYDTSVIYDLSYGRKIEDLSGLKKLTNASLAFDAPVWLEDYKDEVDLDFIIVLGADFN